MVLQWTAPGDDASVGTATSYDIRYSTSAINAANFTAATPSAPGLTPSPAGTQEHYTVTGLAVGVRYSVRDQDQRRARQCLGDLGRRVEQHARRDAALGDRRSGGGDRHGRGHAGGLADRARGRRRAGYRAGCTICAGVSTPRPRRQFLRQRNDDAGTGARARRNPPDLHGQRLAQRDAGIQHPDAPQRRDDAGNFSTVSNDASASTPQVPPAAITDLRQLARGTGSVTVGWTAPGDDGNSGTAVEYDPAATRRRR